MTELVELQKLVEDEREALLTSDWHRLEQCIGRKEALLAPLGQLSKAASGTDPQLAPQLKHQIGQLREATMHNGKLASELGKQLANRLQVHHQGSVYTRSARVNTPRWAVMHRMG